MEIVIASDNKKKIEEIKAIIPSYIFLKTLSEAGYTAELPETTGTIPGNALQKARTLYDAIGKNCLADDSGLRVEGLNGAPGVDSAFYAGLPRNEQANIQKVLSGLTGKVNRKASFITVIALVLDGKEFVFEGVAEGIICESPRGKNGFGYDPIFVPDGYNLTFAELSPEIKNEISHRKKALLKTVDFLKNYHN